VGLVNSTRWEKRPQYSSEDHVPIDLAEIVESLSRLRRRPMIDNPDPLNQTPG